MPANWEKAYSELKGFITDNPQIRIKVGIIAIPADIRPEFYRLFNVVRVAFLEENCQTLIKEASELSNNYIRVVNEAQKSSGISQIKLSSDLNWFLNDPVNGLIRSFYNSLFDLLKGEIDIQAFEREAIGYATSSFKLLLELGYQKWVALSLINMLAPDRALVVPIADIKDMCHEPEADEKHGLWEKKIPDLIETKSIFFGRGLEENSYMIANLVFHSTRLKRYVSLGTDLEDALWTAKHVSHKREWLHLRELGKLIETRKNWPDAVIYVDEDPDDIPLVADFGRFCRPDLILEYIDDIEWYQKGGLEKVKQDYEFFKPVLGSYVISRLPVSDEVLKDLAAESTGSEKAREQARSPETEHPNIHILTVNYDQSQLSPIMDALSTGSHAAS
ncbi:hypothetical protein ACFLYB_02270 [Chloroflexota bacterium]